MPGDPATSPEISGDNLAYEICGQNFDTMESLRERRSTELHESALKQKGLTRINITL